jgi:hypothetical protein
MKELTKTMKKRGNRKSQITLFVILGIIVIVLALLFLFWPKIRVSFVSFSPETYIEKCVSDELDSGLKILSQRGGSLEPENYMSFQGQEVDYLCYTNQYYETCSVQKPLLSSHIESELENYMKDRTDNCARQLEKELEKRGYDVQRGEADMKVELVLNKANIDVELPLTITKENSETYEKFSFSKSTKIYNFAMMTSSILNWESRYGDSETTVYMTYYPNIKVEKLKQGDGSTVYILSDRVSGESFVFASRSLAWPGGLRFGETHTPTR